ncbi:CinA family protein [Brevibacterium litoralis]|uniref:CinA family protein n=1 Tax=Brevibacterium litoralis TaxID=3138935 RepID=UPI0032EDF72D
MASTVHQETPGLAARVIERLGTAGLTLATCESLTAGAVAARLADVPGASAVLRGGLVTYATALKSSLAGVDAGLLEREGAVHPEVAAQMARGAARACGSDLGVSCTGVAGPDPQDGKPVGTVHVALADRRGSGTVIARDLHLGGDRAAIRAATVDAVLRLVLDHADAPGNP